MSLEGVTLLYTLPRAALSVLIHVRRATKHRIPFSSFWNETQASGSRCLRVDVRSMCVILSQQYLAKNKVPYASMPDKTSNQVISKFNKSDDDSYTIQPPPIYGTTYLYCSGSWYSKSLLTIKNGLVDHGKNRSRSTYTNTHIIYRSPF